ncbi:MAG: type I secretion system permease/ATPase [Gammaproteobacteria bacterium]|jgi:ATP-binding cassette subfamily C exporter for protease/lipase|nr:type I secretion system permease/ATPase [Candidatus Neomarinimicrobiota bacterium]MBT4606482.1 type I secretion system permease/ATPase [Thiotrichales bacterium]MBT5746432.1 type I secretion system permease/ATPase [Gammaproteobacteria bacterium]MBT6080701.1 type I secretion system permease/ATPase [Gammaproteobacteria bacterium]MBT6668460.1 type I secretion system permease/ATPase [Gammaproteobacteria bacterium]
MSVIEVPNELSQVRAVIRKPLRQVLLLGIVTNLLILAPTVYMLEVYDRVVYSRSETTLLMLTILVLGAYLLMEALGWLRSAMLHQAGIILDVKLAPRLFEATFQERLRKGEGLSSQPLTDLRTVRSFLSSPGMVALFDAPFSVMFLILVYLIDPLLGMAALFGALVLVVMGGITERGTHAPLSEATQLSQQSLHYANSVMKNAQVIDSMGMFHRVFQHWNQTQQQFLQQQAMASDYAGLGAAGSKFIQTMQGSLLLGLGCWLTLEQDIDPMGGMMIVASILGARALAPMALLISQWRQVVQARDAYSRLDQFLQGYPQQEAGMPLPPPEGKLSVDNLSVVAPGSQQVLLRGVQFSLQPGQLLAVMGPSGSGKTTLVRLLVGLWAATTGKVRLDGVDIYRWNKQELGQYVGYLSQDVDLFEGTLAENIARFGTPDPEQLERVARLVGLTSIIDSLAAGYETEIGVGGAVLSGGQRQRVALARALYANPQYIVLDEPNSSLDQAGEEALQQTLQQLKARGATIIVITHRTSLLSVADQLMIIREGEMQICGPRDQVLGAAKKALETAAAQRKQQLEGGEEV